MTTDRIPDEALAQVSGGVAMPKEFRTYLEMVTNPDVKRYINKEFYKGNVDSAYKHLFQTLRLDQKMEEAMAVKQLYADTHEGAKIPGLL